MSLTSNIYSRPSARYYALGLLTIVYTFNFVDRQLLAILQESIKADLLLSDSQLGLLTGLLSLFFMFWPVFLSLAGRINQTEKI